MLEEIIRGVGKWVKCLIISLLCDLSGLKELEMELFERRVEVIGMYKKKNWNKISIFNEY